MSKRPELLIAFDPGATTGWAVFVRERLVKCGYGAPENLQHPLWPFTSGAIASFEFPIAYDSKNRQKGKENYNDLLRNAQRAGFIQRGYRDSGFEVLEVYPVTWKGNAPKDVTLERVLEALVDSERALLYGTISSRSKSKKLDHNMVDAVGQGLWRLDRY